MPYTVGIIGAARRHQGTGPYIARTFAQLGHNIAGIVATSDASGQQTCAQLFDDYHIRTQAYTSLDQLSNQHDLDILVIASPPASHLRYLQQAVNLPCHVFCEKPLWWPADDVTTIKRDDYLQKIAHIVQQARHKHCYLHINTQWPYTLKDFYRLYPRTLEAHNITHFAMHLSPQSEGINMLVDGASHGLSMLYQLVGAGEIKRIHNTREQASAQLEFDYHHATGITQTTLGFAPSDEIPKPAHYAINGLRVNRRIALPEYQIQLQSDQHTIPIQDPLDASIKDFLAALDAQLETDESALQLGAEHLFQLIEHFI